MNEFPELYSIYRGEVASIQPYGAFIKLLNFKKHGLVHKSQISRTDRVQEVSEVLSKGDQVWAKVISLGEDGERKISLSMKVVNQDNGRDLDPNMVLTKQEEQRRKKGVYVPKPKIELGAVLKTTCKKCGTEGHLSQDCFYRPGERTYDLIPELNEGILSQQQSDMPLVKEKGHKDKKKKKKKNKHRSSDGADKERKMKKKERKKNKEMTTSHTESEEEGKRRKKKKHRRKRREETTLDSDSDESEDELLRRKKKKRKGDETTSGSDSDDSEYEKKKRKIKKRRKGRRESSTDSDSDDSEDKRWKRKKRKRKGRDKMTSDSDSDDSRHVERKRKKNKRKR